MRAGFPSRNTRERRRKEEVWWRGTKKVLSHLAAFDARFLARLRLPHFSLCSNLSLLAGPSDENSNTLRLGRDQYLFLVLGGWAISKNLFLYSKNCWKKVEHVLCTIQVLGLTWTKFSRGPSRIRGFLGEMAFHMVGTTLNLREGPTNGLTLDVKRWHFAPAVS